MSDKTGHYRFDPYASIRNPFPTVGSTPGDVPEDLTYIRQSELDRLRNRLAQIERQVIYRTADMPNWAEVWEKCRNGQCLWDARDAKAPEIAPDLRPDEPGPLWLPIIDPPEDT